MGYDYSAEFQRLKKIRTNDFKEVHGICEWNGNIVTYVDSLLQSYLMIEPYRKLRIPVMVKTVRIDPKILFEAINHYKSEETGQISEIVENQKEDVKKLIESHSEVADIAFDKMKKRFCVFKSSMPFYYDSESKIMVTHGIEIENMTTFIIPRKVDTTNLVLDSYEFVANEDNNAIESCDRKHIIEYLEVFLNNIFISFNNNIL